MEWAIKLRPEKRDWEQCGIHRFNIYGFEKLSDVFMM
jgi:hypothetical protein